MGAAAAEEEHPMLLLGVEDPEAGCSSEQPTHISDGPQFIHFDELRAITGGFQDKDKFGLRTYTSYCFLNLLFIKFVCDTGQGGQGGIWSGEWDGHVPPLLVSRLLVYRPS